MSTHLPTHHSDFPTDLSYVNSHLNVVLSARDVVHVFRLNQDKLSGYGLSMVESLVILNWLVRRMLTELSVRVLDYELNSNYEDLYQDLFQREKDYFLNSVKNAMSKNQFVPTVIQCITNGESVLISLGATNVLDYKKSQCNN